MQLGLFSISYGGLWGQAALAGRRSRPARTTRMQSASPRRAWAAALAICAIACVDGWIVAMPLGVPPRPFGSKTVAGAHVLELPLDDDAVNVAAMFREMSHGLPVVNGYAGFEAAQLRRGEPAGVVGVHAGETIMRRRDPSVLTELRRGHPLYVVVSNTDASIEWAAFMDAQNDATLLEISGAGRLYLMPPSGFAPQVTVGAALPVLRSESRDGWLIFDLGTARAVRGVELRSRGHLTLLRATLKVQTSSDGSTWTTVADEPPGAPALVGALRDPLSIPLRVLLPDPSARYVRLNTGAFPVGAVTIFGP